MAGPHQNRNINKNFILDFNFGHHHDDEEEKEVGNGRGEMGSGKYSLGELKIAPHFCKNLVQFRGQLRGKRRFVKIRENV